MPAYSPESKRNNPYVLFLKDLRAIPYTKLPHGEQLALGQSIETGREVGFLLKETGLEPSETQAKILKEAEGAKLTLITNHLRLMAWVVRRYGPPNVPSPIIMSSAYEKLRNCADNYYPQRGGSFTSYAFTSMRLAVRTAARNEEDSNKDGWGWGYSVTSLDQLKDDGYDLSSSSMGAITSSKGTKVLEAYGTRGSTPEADVIRRDLPRRVEEVFAYLRREGHLPAQRERVLRLYFGFETGHPVSPYSIGEILGIPNTRVREELSKITRRLHSPEVHSALTRAITDGEKTLTQAVSDF